MIRNVSIVSRFARFLRNPQISLQFYPITTPARSLSSTRSFSQRKQEHKTTNETTETTIQRSQEQKNEPLFYNRPLRKRTAVGWCENPPHAPVRRVRRIGRSAFPCGSPTIARHRCVTRLKSTAVSNGTRGLSRGSISFRILSTFFYACV